MDFGTLLDKTCIYNTYTGPGVSWYQVSALNDPKWLKTAWSTLNYIYVILPNFKSGFDELVFSKQETNTNWLRHLLMPTNIV